MPSFSIRDEAQVRLPRLLVKALAVVLIIQYLCYKTPYCLMVVLLGILYEMTEALVESGRHHSVILLSMHLSFAAHSDEFYYVRFVI